MKITVLGCGASTGVPLITGDWGMCNPQNPKNRRRRSSILVQGPSQTILIDTGPDLREQMLTAKIADIDAVCYTHLHYDHIAGVVDLRHLSLRKGKAIPVFGTPSLIRYLTNAYDFMFKPFGAVGHPFLEGHGLLGPQEMPCSPVLEGEPLTTPFTVIPFEQIHGHMPCIGFRIGNFAYSTDMKDLPFISKQRLKNLDVWMVNCLGERVTPAHANLEEVLSFVHELKPKLTVLTHMSAELDYEALAARLPKGVVPAYDGMEFFVDD